MSRAPVALVVCFLIGAGLGSCSDRPGMGAGSGSDAGDGPRDVAAGDSRGTGGSGGSFSLPDGGSAGGSTGGAGSGAGGSTTGAGGASAGGSTGTGGTSTGTGGATTGTGGTTGGAGGTTTTTGGSGGNASAGCPVSPSQCTDGIDNDMDGKTDSLDPECSGPCDNAEATFATGIPGDNMDDESSCKQDCFFDGNSGAEDGCQFDLRCDPARADATKCKTGTQPGGVMCSSFTQQSDTCRNKCRFIPNGCDCFGCCQVPGAGFAVRLNATCTAAAFNDPTKCQRCTPVTSCLNTCDTCEVCYGKPAPDPSCTLPPPGTTVGTGGSGGGTGGTTGGTGGGTGGTGGSTGPCAPGVVYCGSDPNSCPGGYYCLTGCCIRVIID
jgi:hypothetical protein